MSRPVRLGLVGCGRLAEVGYLPALEMVPQLSLVAVADPDAERRERVAALAAGAGASPAGVAVADPDPDLERRARVAARAAGVAESPAGVAPVVQHADLASLLAESAVDVIVLASPAAAHLADARLAAAAGVPVLVEKPPAPDLEGARALAALDPAPWVAFNRRFDPGARDVRAALDGADEVDLELELAYRRSGWSPVAVHDDALLDLGPHLVDWARWLTGREVTEVRSAEVEPARVTLELALGASRARLTAAVDRPHLERITARDRSGRLLARHQAGGLVASVRDRLARRSGPHRLIATLAAELAALVDAVRGDAEAWVDRLAGNLAENAAIAAAPRDATATGPHPSSPADGQGVPVVTDVAAASRHASTATGPHPSAPVDGRGMPDVAAASRHASTATTGPHPSAPADGQGMPAVTDVAAASRPASTATGPHPSAPVDGQGVHAVAPASRPASTAAGPHPSPPADGAVTAAETRHASNAATDLGTAVDGVAVMAVLDAARACAAAGHPVPVHQPSEA